MTQYGAPFDGILIGDATIAPYSAAEWARIWELMHGVGVSFPNYGVFAGSGDGSHQPLEVNSTLVASSNVEIQIGAALIDGRFYENTAVVTMAIGANASGNPRIDMVVLRLDYVAQTVRFVVKQGSPAASPTRPTLQQDATYWEIPLADIAVANGFSTLAQTTITNRQRAIHSIPAGWQHAAYPLNYVAGASYDASAHNLTSASVAIPFVLSGNMLVQDVYYRHVLSVGTLVNTWGIYTQDTNDGLTAEHLIRLVASGGGSTPVAGTANVSVPSLPAPQVLAPGSYWLILRGSGSVGVKTASTAFTEVGYLTGTVAGATMPQTVDMSSGWTPSSSALGVHIRGRVFGLPTVL